MTEPIAIVGVSALFPGSTDSTGFWRDILAGRDLITDVPASHWLIDDYYDPDPSAPDKTYCKRGGFLENVDFDPMEFGVPPSIVPATDTAQLLALIVAQRVLEDASQGQFATMDRERCSVILGVTSAQELLGSMVSRLQKPVWIKALRESGIPEQEAQQICERMASSYVPWQESSFPGLLGNVVAGRIANRFDLRGTNAVTDAACASTLSAMSMGINELVLGQSDLVITGGVDTMNDIFMYMCFSKTPALSKSGDCRPFSDAADGTLLGEGMAMIALKRLADAEKAGDRIYAVIKGLGSSSDGRSKSVYAPLPEGQARALRRCYDSAGYGADTVELVEAHGTGTKAGDAAEFEGLRSVFEEANPSGRNWCALGSVKSQIGHTKAAAGAAGMFKAVMALHHKVLPPTIKIERPNPKMEIEKSAFYLNTEARPYPDTSDHARRASVSSFGFGGSNFHVALEEYTGPNQAWRLRASPSELVMLAADSASALADRCTAIAGEVREKGLAAIARASQLGYQAAAQARMAVVATSPDDFVAKLEQAAAKLKDAVPFSAPGLHFATGPADGGLAFLFPGQGAQYVGMGADVAMAFDLARQAWDQVAGFQFDGKALQDMVFPHPVFSDAEREAQQVELTRTEWAQPAIGVASLALLRVLEAVGVKADCVGGHSFGEITALAAAGAVDPAGLVQIARKRGELMRDAANIPGAMTAVARRVEEVRELIAKFGADVVVANHNHPTQVVLSGATDAIASVEQKLLGEGIAAKRLGVATAFHSPLVASSSAPFRAFLASVAFEAPRVDVYSNAAAAPYPAGADAMRDRLAEQIAKPVRFVEEIEAMWERGVRTFVEVGPGSVLTEMVGRILGKRPHTAIALDRKGKPGVTMLQEGLGRLGVAGVPVDFAPLWAPYAPPSEKPKKKPAMTMPINGINYGKPYPPVGGTRDLPAPNPPRPAPEPVIVHVPVPTPVAAAPIAATVAPAAPESLGWVKAYQEAQRQTADAHAAYQRMMADSHLAFLRTVESSFAGLAGMVGGQPYTPAPAPQPLPVPAPVPVALPAAEPVAITMAPPPPLPAVIPAPKPTPAKPPAPKPAAAPTRDLQSLMLSIVAEKTGYPVEMLGLHMELESDLGIDSIKRVEILSTMREREPALPEVDAGEMAQLRTLGQIVEHMHSHGAPRGPATQPAPTPAASGPAPGTDLEKLMLSVVAEKTGYPAEMLGMHMELESDLGIDSIKRVEILSSMRDREPALPEVDAGEMAQLRTLGQIVDYMRARSPGAAASAPAPAAPAPSHAPASSGIDLEGLMLAVVAEKTGYPAEMLGMHMELESDLGIDSIKRVEILSSMRDRAPELPEVDAGEMAQLRTLGQIVDYMRARSGAPAAAVPVQAPNAPADDGVQRFVVEAVPSDPAGLAPAGLSSGRRAVVTDDGRGVAGQVVRRLGEKGLKAEVVETVPADADVVVFLGGLRDAADVDAAMQVDGEAFRAAKAVATRMTDHGGVFVTVQDTGGDFGLSGADATRAWLAGVAALARTAAVEWPKAVVRALDVERGSRSADAIAAAIVEELFAGAVSREIGLAADGRRITLRAVPRPAAPARTPMDASSVVVASGGGRGVTAVCLVELARRHRSKIVVLGRTALADEPVGLAAISDDAALKKALLGLAQKAGKKVTPAEIGAQVARIQANREIRTTLAAIEKAGGQARYIACDVQDGAALRIALDEVRAAWGPITGFVHGAGVLADKKIADKTAEQFDRVFDTKTFGLRAFLEATADDPIAMMVMFSSVAARTGNHGQVDYAMANEILNKVAAVQRRRGIVVKSIGWGPWEGGMVTPALKAHFEQMGVALIPLATGARLFVDEIDGSPDEVETVIGGAVGEGALGAGTDPSVTLEARVDAASYPFIGDHRIAGKAVVPVVIAIEWMTRAASACRPDLSFAALRDVKVLRGIKLDRFDGDGDRIVLTARQLANGDGATIAVEVKSEAGALYYSATAEMVSRRAPVPRAQLAVAVDGAVPDPVYDGHTLFHGPGFQAIRSLDGVSREGIAGTLAGATELGWVGRFATDPAILDGGMQLAVLWARHVLGGASLPMAVGAFHLYEAGLPEGPIRCVVHGRQTSDQRAVSDVAFAHPDGRLVAELRGVETILRPGEKVARSSVRA